MYRETLSLAIRNDPARRPTIRSRHRRTARWTVIVAVGIVILLLSEGLPAPGSATPAKGSPARAVSTSVPVAPRDRSSNTQTSPNPTSGPGYQSLCLLAVLLQCARGVHRTAPAPLIPDPVSSWTNITPPSGKANPTARTLPSMTYYPAGHDVLLFGGRIATGSLYAQDTWSFAQNNWTELIANTSCTPTTCPSPRADAMMAYYAPLHAILLFGGEISFLFFTTTYNDSWLYYAGQWHNITSTAGPAPSPRLGGAMTWDSLDNQVLLFGGALSGGQTLGDTWTFDGKWKNISASFVGTSPSTRAGAAMSGSPSGYIMMFGGEEWNGTADAVLYDDASSCFPLPHVAWWFYRGSWSPMKYGGVCVQVATGAPAQPPGFYPPCGRVGAALGWSPKNDRFVLYGGYGPVYSTTFACSGPDGYLNDTYTYTNSPGSGFNWQYVGDSGDPSNRTYVGFASDYTDNYFVIFGGSDATTIFESSWRYYALVHAKLSGPSSVNTNASILSFNVPFTVVGFGGSGTLDYTFHVGKLRNSNPLIDGGQSSCGNLTSGSAYPLPYDGTWRVACTPSPQSYNVYRLTLYVWDVNNATLSGGYPVSGDYATANWTFTVVPPESALLFSEYTKYFYEGFDFNNIFGAYLKVAGGSATSVSATLGGIPVGFVQRAPNSFWWNSTPVDMGHVSPGAVLSVTGYFGNWTLNASYAVNIISTPSWLYSLFVFTGAVQMIPTSGAGPYNKTYGIFENYSWSLGGSTSFALPTPMLDGSTHLIPAIAVSFEAASSGQLALSGTLSLTPPSISFGVVSLSLSVSVGLTGNFVVLNASQGISDVQWVNAQATLTLAGDLGASIPIYGFNVLGVNVGFTLAIDIKPSLALSLVLLPTTPGFNEIIPGIEMMVSQLIGAFTLALQAAVVFGIGFASVSIGIVTSIALAFNITPTFHIGAGWLNGTFFAAATFLWWNITWNIVGPGVIYAWSDPPPGMVSPLTACPTCYNNGANASWTVHSRYYVGAGYDANVWDLNVSQGPAVSDIYPHTEMTAAPGYNGGYLFYSDDDPTVPVQQGLRVSGLRLDPSTNRLSSIPSPSDPGFVLDHPEATALPDGSIYVVWAAVPTSESSLASPAALSSVQLHGARFYPSNQSWGPVRTWTSWGIAEAYRLDGTDSSGTLVALVAPSFLVGGNSVERLVAFDLASGREVSNMSVTGLSEIPSVRAGLSDAVVQNVGGNYSVLNFTTGATVPLSFPSLSGYFLISESFVTGSPSTLVLLFRNPNATELVLYDLATGQGVGIPTDQSATTAEALYGGGAYYIFERVHAGVQGWTESAGEFSNLTMIIVPNLVSFGLVQVGSSILAFSLASNGNVPQPVVTLELAELGGTLPKIPGAPVSSSPRNPSNPSGGSSPNYLLYLELVAAADVLLLAVVAVWRRRRSRSNDRIPPSGPSTQPPEGASPPPPSG